MATHTLWIPCGRTLSNTIELVKREGCYLPSIFKEVHICSPYCYAWQVTHVFNSKMNENVDSITVLEFIGIWFPFRTYSTVNCEVPTQHKSRTSNII